MDEELKKAHARIAELKAELINPCGSCATYRETSKDLVWAMKEIERLRLPENRGIGDVEIVAALQERDALRTRVAELEDRDAQWQGWAQIAELKQRAEAAEAKVDLFIVENERLRNDGNNNAIVALKARREEERLRAGISQIADRSNWGPCPSCEIRGEVAGQPEGWTWTPPLSWPVDDGPHGPLVQEYAEDLMGDDDHDPLARIADERDALRVEVERLNREIEMHGDKHMAMYAEIVALQKRAKEADIWRSDPLGGMAAVDHWKTKAEALETRVSELLALVAKISQETPLPDEVAQALTQRGAMLAEIGTLRSALKNRETPDLDMDLLRKLASGEGGRRTGALRRAGYFDWVITGAGLDALAAHDAKVK